MLLSVRKLSFVCSRGCYVMWIKVSVSEDLKVKIIVPTDTVYLQ
jgi:hypothetical protein